jgi:hypothetical protein
MVVLAALALALVAADRPSPLPDPTAVRNTAHEVLARPEFQVDGSTEAVEGLWDFLVRLFFRITHSLRGLFEWLYLLSPLLAWLFIGALVTTLAVLVGHIVWTIFMVLRRDRRKTALANALILDKVNPADLARQAESARAGGDYMLGVRLLFRACLALLEQREGKSFRPGATNREHLNRYRQTPLYDWLARFVWVIDSKWYGSEACLPADFAACHEAYEWICSLSAGRVNAQHA